MAKKKSPEATAPGDFKNYLTMEIISSESRGISEIFQLQLIVATITHKLGGFSGDNVIALHRPVEPCKCKFLTVAHDECLIFAKTRTGRYEVSANHILLHAIEHIDLTVDSCLIKNLGGFLE